jgi:hypothetical protein
VVLWLLALLYGHAAALLARASGDARRELRGRRRLVPLVAIEHGALLVALGSGALLLAAADPALVHARWVALKLGLVLFLIVPLEAMHAFIAHVWTARGLAQTERPPFSKDLARSLGIEEMVRTLSIPLLGLGIPLILWLSLRRPF